MVGKVVDDSVARVVIAGDGVLNSPAPVGSWVEIRLLHVFEMRAGKISRELVFETWRVLEEAVGQMPYAAADTSLVSPVHPAH